MRLDQDRAALTAARIDPQIILDGAFPRLIDEYQLVDGLWEAECPATALPHRGSGELEPEPSLAEPHRASVCFYRDNKSLEVDAVVEAGNGRWIAAEVKLGATPVC